MVASASLESVFSEYRRPADAARINNILAGFAELSPHADAKTAFRALHDAGFRIVALTNGSAETTQKLLQRAGLYEMVERAISVEEVRHWKPRREVYLHAAKSLDVNPSSLALVAAHAWDIHGAGRAGLTTAFVSRGLPHPPTMVPPHVAGETLSDVAVELTRIGTGKE